MYAARKKGLTPKNDAIYQYLFGGLMGGGAGWGLGEHGVSPLVEKKILNDAAEKIGPLVPEFEKMRADVREKLQDPKLEGYLEFIREDLNRNPFAYVKGFEDTLYNKAKNNQD